MVILHSMSGRLLMNFSPGFKWLCHKLPKILTTYLFRCIKCTGSTVHTIIMSTIVKPGVLLQPRWLKLSIRSRIRRTCSWVRWCVTVGLCGQDTILDISTKLIHVVMRLHKFPNVILKSSGTLRGVSNYGAGGTYKGTHHYYVVLHQSLCPLTYCWFGYFQSILLRY